MYIFIMSIFILLCCSVDAYASDVVDSIQRVDMGGVVVLGDRQQRIKESSPLSVDVVDKEVFAENFSGNMVASLEHIPGIQSMSIGSGFAKRNSWNGF